MTDTITEPQAPCHGDTHDPYEVPRIRGVMRPVDTGTFFVMKALPDDESFDGITPAALVWAAEQMRAHALRYVSAVFDLIAAEIPGVGKAAVAFMMAEADMSCGTSLRSALGDLLLAAERDMECADMANHDCQCGACCYALTMEQEHSVPGDVAERLAAERLIATGGAL